MYFGLELGPFLGISVGIPLLVILIAVILYFVYKRRQRYRPGLVETDNELTIPPPDAEVTALLVNLAMNNAPRPNTTTRSRQQSRDAATRQNILDIALRDRQRRIAIREAQDPDYHYFYQGLNNTRKASQSDTNQLLNVLTSEVQAGITRPQEAADELNDEYDLERKLR